MLLGRTLPGIGGNSTICCAFAIDESGVVAMEAVAGYKGCTTETLSRETCATAREFFRGLT